VPIAKNSLNTGSKLTFLITVLVRFLMVVGVFMIFIIHFSHLESSSSSAFLIYFFPEHYSTNPELLYQAGTPSLSGNDLGGWNRVVVLSFYFPIN